MAKSATPTAPDPGAVDLSDLGPDGAPPRLADAPEPKSSKPGSYVPNTKTDRNMFGILSEIDEIDSGDQESGEEPTEKPEKKPKEPAPSDPGTSEDVQEEPAPLEVDGYKPFDDEEPPPGSHAIKEKFKRLKEASKTNEKALLKAVQDARREAEEAKKLVESSRQAQDLGAAGQNGHQVPEEVAKEVEMLRQKAENLEKTLSRVRLEESPAFQEKFDKAIESISKKCGPHIASAESKEEAAAVRDALIAASGIPPTDENDDRFFREVDRAIQAIPSHHKLPLFNYLSQMRELQKDRRKALEDADATRKGFDLQIGEEAATKAKRASSDFDLALSVFESDNQGLVGAFRSPDAKGLAYDETVAPEIEKARRAVAEAARSGSVNRDVISLALMGAQAKFAFSKLHDALGVIGSLNERAMKAEAALQKATKSPSAGGTHRGAHEVVDKPDDDDDPRYGILSTSRRLAREGV